jgi:hypothetical protein
MRCSELKWMVNISTKKNDFSEYLAELMKDLLEGFLDLVQICFDWQRRDR